MRNREEKVIDIEKAVAVRDAFRAEGKTVAFTNGCYDLLHAGHVCSIEYAREQADVLLLGMNSDDSVKRNKGPNRPIIGEAERAIMLSALEAVDYVVVFDDTEVMPVIERLKPDVLVKGQDRAGEVVGQDFVESYGGKVVLAKLVEGFSTTKIIGKVVDTYGTQS
jgi:rfaE bifunctional protein nucleotidyltransferase chain/domain